MKKLLIVLALVLAFSVVFVACNKDKGDDVTTDAPETTAGEESSTTAAGGETTTEGNGETPTEEPTTEPDGETTTEDDGNTSTEEPTTEPGEDLTDDDTTTDGNGETPTEDSTTAPNDTTETEAPAQETIPYIGALHSINGLGPNGKKFTASNAYSSYSPNTNNPDVTILPPLSEDAFDYYCRTFTIGGWAILEGGQGDFVWSDDGGKTWKAVDEQTLSDSAYDLAPFATVANIKNLSIFDADFTITIDLSDYEDDEYVTIWVGRKSSSGAVQAIFKFGEVCVGDEVYVPETHEECDHISFDDVTNPITIVSFDVCSSSHGITDAAGRTDRLRVWNYGTVTGDSIGNNTIRHTWNKVLRFLEKDKAISDHVFTIEGWTGYNSALNEANITFTGEVYRNGELLKTANGYTVPQASRPDIATATGYAHFNAYKLWLGVADLESGDTVHIVLTYTDGDVTTKYCIKDFTIEFVADDTDLTCTDNP